MASFEAELLDAYQALRLLVVAQDDGKRYVVGLGGFELILQPGFLLICELGLFLGG